MAEQNWQGVELFHYTDFCALDGILKNKELWMCSTKSMNDKKEMLYFMERLEQAVMEGLSTEQASKARALFAEQKGKLENSPVYSASFSKLKDDAAQWERYGASGGGVCIAFDAEALRQALLNYGCLQSVFYRESVKSHAHVLNIKKYLEDENSILCEWSNIDGVFENAWACSASFKHPSFQSEAEVRAETLPFCDEKARYLVRTTGIREYLPISLASQWDAPLIKEVHLGPRSNVTLDTMERYLKSLGNGCDNIPVKISQCPLR